MNRKERFLTALQVREPDRVPMFDFLFQQPMFEALIGHRPGVYNARDAIACALALDHDAVWLPFGGYNGFQPTFISEDTYIDEWCTTYRHNDASWPIDAPIDYPIKGRRELAAYRSPDPTMAGRLSEIESAHATPNDNLALLGGITGPFTTAWLLMGYERICYAIHDDPGLVTEVFKISNDYNKEAARQLASAGVDGIFLGDDFGDSRSGFMKLRQFRELVLPYVADLVEYAANLGVPILLHSCGHITEYLDDLAQTKLVAIHPLQRTAGMSLQWVKEHYGKRFCIIGNIDSSVTLPFGTADEVADEVREAIDIAAPGGGYVLASDHSLHDGISIENIVTLFKTGRDYAGSYYRA